MAYTRRKFNKYLKSLLHFDYPYYAEPNDGMRDEISGETWARLNSTTKLAGHEIPCDEINENLPKFGYRCLNMKGGGIRGTNISGIWSIDFSKSYEIEFWLYPESLPGAISTFFQLQTIEGETVTTVSSFCIGAENHMLCSPGATKGTKKLEAGKWQHVLIRINAGNLTAYVDGEVSSTGTNSGTITPTHVTIGQTNQNIYLDEFAFWHKAGTTAPAIPTEPYNGYIDIKDIGGVGDGKHGHITIAKDTQINTYGKVTQILGTYLTVASWNKGVLGEVSEGDELMILVTAKSGSAEEHLGCYAFRRVVSVHNSQTVVLDSEITSEFPASECPSQYIVQAIQVANFESLTVTAGKVIPLAYNASKGGGIIAMRSKGNITLSGSGMIISSGYGPTRSDLQQVCHANVIDKFICNKGGGIFIACEKTFSAGGANRVGATWDGSLGAGVATQFKAGSPGGAGYGGAGGSDITDVAKGGGGVGGVGGVGGAGGAAHGAKSSGGAAGQAGTGNSKGAAGTGGGGGTTSTAQGSGSTSKGGIQGRYVNSPTGCWSTGGGGAGGNAGRSYHSSGPFEGAYSGANLILFTKTLSVDAAAISTGGAGGAYSKVATGGGGGTGFAFIACKEMK